jgi:geranylgeranyl pyrophosphate synthase
MTLPLIRLVESDVTAREMLINIMDEGIYHNGMRVEIAQRLKDFEILQSTKKAAFDFGKSARKSLEVLPETEYRSALETIPEFVIQRTK